MPTSMGEHSEAQNRLVGGWVAALKRIREGSRPCGAHPEDLDGLYAYRGCAVSAETHANESAMRYALTSLSRDDALLICARINAGCTTPRHPGATPCGAQLAASCAPHKASAVRSMPTIRLFAAAGLFAA
jgi:hypothetical protein